MLMGAPGVLVPWKPSPPYVRSMMTSCFLCFFFGDGDDGPPLLSPLPPDALAAAAAAAALGCPSLGGADLGGTRKGCPLNPPPLPPPVEGACKSPAPRFPPPACRAAILASAASAGVRGLDVLLPPLAGWLDEDDDDDGAPPRTNPLPGMLPLLDTPLPRVTPEPAKEVTLVAPPEVRCLCTSRPAAPPPPPPPLSSPWWYSEVCWCSCLNGHSLPLSHSFLLPRPAGSARSLCPDLVLVLERDTSDIPFSPSTPSLSRPRQQNLF